MVSSTVVPSATSAFDHLPQAQPAARVEAGGRLVEEQHRRLCDERGGEVEAAAHPARVGLGRSSAGVDEVEALEQLAAAGLGVPAAGAVEPSDHRQVLEAGEVFVDRRVLAGEPDPLAQRGSVVAHVEAEHARAAGVGLQQRGEDAHERRLAGAVRAQQPHDLALPDGQVDAVERAHLAEALDEAAHLDRGRIAHPALRLRPPFRRSPRSARQPRRASVIHHGMFRGTGSTSRPSSCVCLEHRKPSRRPRV